MIIHEDYSLLEHNTFGIAAKAHFFVEYQSIEELQDFIHKRQKKGDTSPLLHIGGGSNLLFLDDYEGAILHSLIKDIRIIDEDEEVVVVCVGAGMVWDEWVEIAIDKGWFGLENLSLIPGEVGASAVQNIGAYGSEAKDFISHVEAVDLQTGEIRVFNRAECQYAYRHSIFKTALRGRYAVTHVEFRLSRRFRPNLEYGALRSALANNGILLEQVTPSILRKTIIDIRENKLPDPKKIGNAGSFFTNPIVERTTYERIANEYPSVPHYEVDSNHVKIPAGWMIEQCGWKGKALGPAAVYDRQALVLVNLGGANGHDIEKLCQTIQADVYQRFQVKIVPEVNFI